MKLKELVELVNQKIEAYELNKEENETYYDDCGYKVGSLVKEVLKENGIEVATYIYPRKSEVEINFSDYQHSIYIKVRRKKGTTENTCWSWRSYTKYYLDKVELVYPDDEQWDKTFDQLFQEWIQQQLEKNQQETIKINEIIEDIKKLDMDYYEFESLVYNFKKYSWKIREKMKGEN